MNRNMIPFLCISIHAPAKGATYPLPSLMSVYEFQSTLPRRERLVRLFVMRSIPLFQSTLPRRERRLSFSFFSVSVYFNPRSREGSDCRWSSASPLLSPHFNPRSREGSDVRRIFQPGQFFISIHAPAKGAT